MLPPPGPDPLDQISGELLPSLEKRTAGQREARIVQEPPLSRCHRIENPVASASQRGTRLISWTTSPRARVNVPVLRTA